MALTQNIRCDSSELHSPAHSCVQTGASLNLTDFCKKFGGGAAPPALGNAREYNIDLIPKCVMPSATAMLAFILFASAIAPPRAHVFTGSLQSRSSTSISFGCTFASYHCSRPAPILINVLFLADTSWLMAISSRCSSRLTSTSEIS